MMSGNRGDYASASEWLSVLRQDEVWLRQQQRLSASPATDVNIHREDAIRRIGQGETFEFWEIYGHQVEPVICEVWEIAELSLPKLKIQTIGMLSMEWIEQQTETGITKKAKKPTMKKKPEKPEKPREAMTFKRKGSVTEPHLLLLYMALTKDGWIDGNDADFKALFSGSRDEDCELVWLGKYGKGTLVELFKQLAGAGLIEVPQGFTLSAILEGHFKDKNGQWLTGLDKGDAANDKAMPVIKECIKQMKTDPQRLLNGDYEEDDDFRSEYDRFDQQDMHWHTH
jgi:hypothetical protein